MKNMKLIITALFFSLTMFGFAQAPELLKTLPETKEQFIESEKNLLATIDWLENTPINENEQKHKEQYALLIGWITNSPTVTVELNEKVITFTKKNSELLIFFLGGWARYSITHNYSNDIVQGSLAGIRSAIKMYKSESFKKDKEMKHLIELEETGELEKWVSEQLSKK